LARCMRANGVPNFPDPVPGGGFLFPMSAGINVSSPAVEAAQAACRRFAPRPPVAAGPTFSAQALRQVLNIAQCMRQHGVSAFPDPQRASATSLPSRPPAGVGLITDYRGVLLEFPATINIQAPAYRQAAATCGATFLTSKH
jgi:hypothetical protein